VEFGISSSGIASSRIRLTRAFAKELSGTETSLKGHYCDHDTVGQAYKNLALPVGIGKLLLRSQFHDRVADLDWTMPSSYTTQRFTFFVGGQKSSFFGSVPG